MKFEKFKSGTYLQQYQYKSFLPEKINRQWIWDDPRINVLLEKATRALGLTERLYPDCPRRGSLHHPYACDQGSQHIQSN